MNLKRNQSVTRSDISLHDRRFMSQAGRFITRSVQLSYVTVACMTGALWAKRGERDISRVLHLA